MAIPQNTPKRLFVPRKTDPNAHQPGYGQDMRAIEAFNPINKLVAGSGVTLTPSNGEGPQVEIAASGGAGITSTLMSVNTGPDFADFPFNLLPFAGGWWQSTLVSWIQLFNTGVNVSANPNFYHQPCGLSWLTNLGAGQTVCAFPSFGGVQFTTLNPSVNAIDIAEGFMWASNADFTSAIQCAFTVPFGTMTSGVGFQIDTTTCTVNYTQGADLSLVPGTSGSGDGIVTAGGGPYFAGVSCYIGVPSQTTFTNP